jgi:amino acid transporter
MLVPYDSEDLAFATKAKNSAAASPFVVAMKQVAALPHIINACILVFVLSAANSDLYIATRTLYGLAREKKAPKIFARTNQAGVPIFALILSASFCLLAFMSVSNGSKAVFGYFTDMVSIFGRMFYLSPNDSKYVLFLTCYHSIDMDLPLDHSHLFHSRSPRPGRR